MRGREKRTNVHGTSVTRLVRRYCCSAGKVLSVFSNLADPRLCDCAIEFSKRGDTVFLRHFLLEKRLSIEAGPCKHVRTQGVP